MTYTSARPGAYFPLVAELVGLLGRALSEGLSALVEASRPSNHRRYRLRLIPAPLGWSGETEWG